MRERLSRMPLYAYAQLEGGRGVRKQSSAAARSGVPGSGSSVSSRERGALRWYAATGEGSAPARGVQR
jgi:hypothetical protein